jgi:hypothetical protein
MKPDTERLILRLRKTTEAGRARHLSKADRLAVADALTAAEARADKAETQAGCLLATALNAVIYKDRAEAAEAKVEKLTEALRAALEAKP